MGFRDRGDRRGGGGRGFHDRGGYGGGGGGGGYPQREAPVKSGEEYDVEITDIAAKGDGICKIEGFIIFVPGTSKGEKCRIRVNEVRNRFALAQKVGEGSGNGGMAEESEVPSDSEESEEPSGETNAG